MLLAGCNSSENTLSDAENTLGDASSGGNRLCTTSETDVNSNRKGRYSRRPFYSRPRLMNLWREIFIDLWREKSSSTCGERNLHRPMEREIFINLHRPMEREIFIDLWREKSSSTFIDLWREKSSSTYGERNLHRPVEREIFIDLWREKSKGAIQQEALFWQQAWIRWLRAG